MKQKRSSPSPAVILYEFKLRYSLEHRRAETEDVLIRVPDKVPVIVEEVSENSWLPPLARRKLLLPRQMTAGQLIYLLRARLYIPSNMPLLVFMGERTVQVTDFIGHIYDKFHDEDGFLYVAYSPHDHLSGPKKNFRVHASPPPPPTSPTSSIDQLGPTKSVRKTRKTRATKNPKSVSVHRKMRKAGSKHSDDRSQKSSPDGSMKRQTTKRGVMSVDDNVDGRKKKSEDKKDRESRKFPEHLGSINSMNSPDDLEMKPKTSQIRHSSSARSKRATSSKQNQESSARGTKT